MRRGMIVQNGEAIIFFFFLTKLCVLNHVRAEPDQKGAPSLPPPPSSNHFFAVKQLFKKGEWVNANGADGHDRDEMCSPCVFERLRMRRIQKEMESLIIPSRALASLLAAVFFFFLSFLFLSLFLCARRGLLFLVFSQPCFFFYCNLTCRI